jgi:hypothetical protein
MEICSRCKGLFFMLRSFPFTFSNYVFIFDVLNKGTASCYENWLTLLLSLIYLVPLSQEEFRPR